MLTPKARGISQMDLGEEDAPPPSSFVCDSDAVGLFRLAGGIERGRT